MPRRQLAPPSSPSMHENFAAMKADYAAAKPSRHHRRRKGLAAAGAGADYHYRNESDYLRLIESARDIDRNDPFMGQLVTRAVDNTIQGGIAMDPATGDKGADTELAARWRDWAEDEEQCDRDGEHTFWDFENLILRAILIDGDQIVLPTDDGLQLIEGHRVRTPKNTKKNVVHGVLLGEGGNNRRRKEYWITKDDINPLATLSRVSDCTRHPVRDAHGNRILYHPYTSRRSTQTRGISAFAPIFEFCSMFEDINFAKLVQQQVVSCFAVFRQFPENYQGDPTRVAGEQSTEPLADGTTRTIEGIAPGMEIIGRPGEILSMDSPNVPNPEWFAHMRLIMTIMGINLGMPLVMATMDASETNFSGYRGAVDQARLGFRQNQRRLYKRFHRHVWAWRVRVAIADDAALRTAAQLSNVNLFRHNFQPPSWPYIEPTKDAASDLLQLCHLLNSPRRIHANRGRDWDTVGTEIVDDNVTFICKALDGAEQIEKKYPDWGGNWRDVIVVPTPSSVTLKLTPGDAEPETQEGKTDGSATNQSDAA